jgi:hypothetical protein
LSDGRSTSLNLADGAAAMKTKYRYLLASGENGDLLVALWRTHNE